METKEIEEKFLKYKPLLKSLANKASSYYSYVDFNDAFSFLSFKFVELCKRFDPVTYKHVFFGYWIKKNLLGWTLMYVRDLKRIFENEVSSSSLSILFSLLPGTKLNKKNSHVIVSTVDYDFEDKIVDRIVVGEIIKEFAEKEPENAEMLVDVFYRGYSLSHPYMAQKYNLSKVGCYKRMSRVLKRIRESIEDERDLR